MSTFRHFDIRSPAIMAMRVVSNEDTFYVVGGPCGGSMWLLLIWMQQKCPSERNSLGLTDGRVSLRLDFLPFTSATAKDRPRTVRV